MQARKTLSPTYQLPRWKEEVNACTTNLSQMLYVLEGIVMPHTLLVLQCKGRNIWASRALQKTYALLGFIRHKFLFHQNTIV